MATLLGIDIGTSACKVALFNEDGTVVAHTTEEYAVQYPKQGWAQQDPDIWWEKVISALSSLLENRDTSDIAGIGIDGISWASVMLDKDGNVLADCPLWMDIRAEKECEFIENTISSDKLFNVSGNPVKPMYTMPKVLWFKNNYPDIYNKTAYVMQCNSFIAYRLTGEISQDYSQGYGWQCYNIAKHEWNYDYAKDLGLRRDLLLNCVESHKVIGRVTKRVAEITGLKEGTPVVAGGLDAACGSLGAGVYKTGQTQEQGGQAGGMSICLDKYVAEKSLICGCHVVPDHWLLQGGTVGGGGVINWFRKQLCDSEDSFADMSAMANKVSAGSEGLVFLPYMAGERSPIWNSKAKGVFYGLDYSKTKGHMIRSCMEGVAFALQHNLEVAASAGAKVDVLNAMGGSANSLVWTQIKADVTGCKICVPSSDTATTLGASILAGVGTGVYGSFKEAVDTCVHITREHIPNTQNEEVYKETYKTYRKLYENLKDMMGE